MGRYILLGAAIVCGWLAYALTDRSSLTIYDNAGNASAGWVWHWYNFALAAASVVLFFIAIFVPSPKREA